jgi:DNA polymerase I-like protein with 3'-5' exonuclease and polymerase domains
VDDHQKSYHLEELCQSHFGLRKEDKALLEWLAAKFGGEPTRKAQMKHIVHAPRDMVAYYGIGDVKCVEMLYNRQMEEYTQQDLWKVSELERKTTRALWWTERIGVPIDMERLEKSEKGLKRMWVKVQEEINNLVGRPTNVKSNKDLLYAFDHLGLECAMSASGNGKFDKDTLKAIDHPLCKQILKLRSIRVMIETFIDTIRSHAHDDGRIHCNLNQTKTEDYGVKTGRLSASDPNLQQIPKRNDEFASLIRSLFVAVSGMKWFRADWSQFEFRMFAHYTKSPALIEKFKQDKTIDYHQAVADLTGLIRDPHAKQLNLGLVFGMGEGLMAMKCGLPYRIEIVYGKEVKRAGDEAKKIFNTYHQTLPEVRQMLLTAERKAKAVGFVRTLFGRKLRFPNRYGCHKAAGYVFQGSSADMMKKKCCELVEASYGTDVQFMLPVHDEFNLLGPIDAENEIKEVMASILEDCPEMRVPVYADIGMGDDWWQATKGA